MKEDIYENTEKDQKKKEKKFKIPRFKKYKFFPLKNVKLSSACLLCHMHSFKQGAPKGNP